MRTLGKYILQGQEAVPVDDLDGWITVYEGYEKRPRRVKLDMRGVREEAGCEDGKQGAASREG